MNLLLCQLNDDSLPLLRSAAHVRFTDIRSRAFGPMEKDIHESAFVPAQRRFLYVLFRTALRFREHYTTSSWVFICLWGRFLFFVSPDIVT